MATALLLQLPSACLVRRAQPPQRRRRRWGRSTARRCTTRSPIQPPCGQPFGTPNSFPLPLLLQGLRGAKLRARSGNRTTSIRTETSLWRRRSWATVVGGQQSRTVAPQRLRCASPLTLRPRPPRHPAPSSAPLRPRRRCLHTLHPPLAPAPQLLQLCPRSCRGREGQQRLRWWRT